MTIKVSTGCRNKLLDTNPLRTIFNLGFIKIYDGPIPATADAALDGANHLLATISNNGTGTGITFETAAANGAIAKKASETWSGTAGTTGTASFYRLVAAGDGGALSTTEARIQGSVGTSAADLNLADITITSSDVVPVDEFSVGLPTL